MLEVSQVGPDTDLSVWVNTTLVWTHLVIEALSMKITTSRMVVAIVILLPNTIITVGPMSCPYFMGMETIRVPTSLSDIIGMFDTSRKQA